MVSLHFGYSRRLSGNGLRISVVMEVVAVDLRLGFDPQSAATFWILGDLAALRSKVYVDGSSAGDRVSRFRAHPVHMSVLEKIRIVLLVSC